MGSVDKFGRPLRREDFDGKSAAAAIVEALRLDTDGHYTALDKRIKMIAEPEDGSDAVNRAWVDERMHQLKEFLEASIDKSRELLLNELAAENRFKSLDSHAEREPSVRDEYSTAADSRAVSTIKAEIAEI